MRFWTFCSCISTNTASYYYRYKSSCEDKVLLFSNTLKLTDFLPIKNFIIFQNMPGIKQVPALKSLGNTSAFLLKCYFSIFKKKILPLVLFRVTLYSLTLTYFSLQYLLYIMHLIFIFQPLQMGHLSSYQGKELCEYFVSITHKSTWHKY